MDLECFLYITTTSYTPVHLYMYMQPCSVCTYIVTCGYRNLVIGLMFIYRHETEQW